MDHKWRKRLMAFAGIAVVLMILSSFGGGHAHQHYNNFGGGFQGMGYGFRDHVNPLFALIGTLVKAVFAVVLLAAVWLFWTRSRSGTRKGLLIALVALMLLPFCGPLLLLVGAFFFIKWRKKRCRHQGTHAFEGGFTASDDAASIKQEVRDTLDEWERKIRVNLKKEDK